MTKLNTANQLTDDDERLVILLREHTEGLPVNLEEKTLSKLLALHAEQRIAFKPLRIPLYLMSVIILFLILPLFIPVTSDSDDNAAFLSELLRYSDNLAIRYVVIGWLILAGLAISALIFSTDKPHVNTFKP